MRLETTFIALIIGSLFFSGFYNVFLDAADEYNVDYDLSVMETQNGTSVEDAFNRINQSKTEMDSLKTEFETTLLREENSLFPFFSLALKMGKSIYRSLTIFKDVMNIFTELLGIPTEFVIVFFSILTIVFVLLVVFILLGRAT